MSATPSLMIYVPVAFVRPQEPTSAPDTPAGVTGGGSAQGGSAVVPGGAPDKAPAGQPANPCADPTTLLMMGGALALMYFMVMRPEQKRRKEQQSLLAAVKQGDRVVTIGGQHGVIQSLSDKTVTLRIDSITSTFDRSAIARIVRDEPPAGAKA